MKKITIKSLYFAKSFDIKEAEHLFRLLKRDFYYENVNLFGRLAVAEFESEKFEDKIKEFVNNINHPDVTAKFESKIKEIKSRILPKKCMGQRLVVHFLSHRGTETLRKTRVKLCVSAPPWQRYLFNHFLMNTNITQKSKTL